MNFTHRLRGAPVRGALGLLAAWAMAWGASGARAADSDDIQTDQLIFISPAGEAFSAPVTDPYPVVKWFARMDKKGDGKVDIDEFRADAMHVFDALDRDHDGLLDSGEIHAYEGYLVPIVTQVNPLGGETAADQGASPFSLFKEPEPITAADRNFDFKITRQEFLDQADRHFHTLDKGAKGYITLAELPRTDMEVAYHATRVAKATPASAGAKPAGDAAKGN
ncbi:MAG TPA: hypothetical protein VMU59_09770 [Caulobacteraceae bacterium]|nr:hypothetical protein [Caulobacteraceae bacterium]